jgi:hypothetical protein
MQITSVIFPCFGRGILLLLLASGGCYESQGKRFSDDAAPERTESDRDEEHEAIVDGGEEGPAEAIPEALTDDCPQGYGPSSSALTTDISMEVVQHTLSQTDVTEGLTDLDPSLVTADLDPVMECGG